MLDTATQAAAEPQEYYDTLPQTAQDTWDAVASYGWRPEKMELGFIATRNSDGFEIGPFENLSVLLAEVQQEAEITTEDTEGTEATDKDHLLVFDDDPMGINAPLPIEDEDDEDSETANGEQPTANSDEVELTEDSKGPRLPGVPLVVDQQIADAAGKFLVKKSEAEEAAAAFKAAGEGKKAALAELLTIAKMKLHLFHADEHNPRERVYNAGGMIIRLSTTTEETIDVETDTEAKPRKARKK